MRIIAVITLPLLLPLAGGCLQQQPEQAAVTALIASSSTQGPAPLTVTFSAAGSSARNGGPLTYAWDFGDGTSSAKVSETHVFAAPGRYIVTLRVTDSADEQDVDSVDIRAQGTKAVAIITTDVSAGTAPLTVQFDGTRSDVPDDTILDYYWDFGDGQQSRADQPVHTFWSAGTFTVTLRIVTAGGLEARTNTTITVGKRTASLQFDGATFATLPLGSQLSAQTFTVDAWVNAENEGGTIVSVGTGALTLELRPTTNTVRLQVNGMATDATVTSLAKSWRHVAAVYDGAVAGVCVLYLDGVPVASTAVSGLIAIDRLTIGIGLRGKIGEVRFWVKARTGPEIQSTLDQRLSGREDNLLGYWPIDEGSGQTLHNLARPASNGYLGSSAATDSADPAWSTDVPPL